MGALRSTSPSIGKLGPSSFVKIFTILATFVLVISYAYWSHLGSPSVAFIRRGPNLSDLKFDTPTGQNWTHRIWQTSKNPIMEIGDEDREHVRTWAEFNPEYRHEVLTDEMMESYVRDHFHTSHPEIEEIYFDVKDYIVRSDLIRYLILLADGGVYNDLDVGCEKPIRTWVPKKYEKDAGILLGVEVDNKFGPDGRTFTNGVDLFQLVNWTIMSKPNQPFMWFLVKRVMKNIRELAKLHRKSISNITFTIQNVLDSTGPAALTRAFFDYASDITASNVTYHNFTKMRKPRLIGEVVILPIQAFGAGHQVEWAGFQKDGTELIHHYFAGSWKTDHVDEPVHLETDEGKKAKELEKKQQEEEESQRKKEQEEGKDPKKAEDEEAVAEEESVGEKKAEYPQQAHKDQQEDSEEGAGPTESKQEPSAAPASDMTVSKLGDEKTISENTADSGTGQEPSADDGLTPVEHTTSIEDFPGRNLTANVNKTTPRPDDESTVKETVTDLDLVTVEEVPDDEAAGGLEAHRVKAKVTADTKANMEAETKANQKAATEIKEKAELRFKAAKARKKAYKDMERAREQARPDPQWKPLEEAGEIKASTKLAKFSSDDIDDLD